MCSHPKRRDGRLFKNYTVQRSEATIYPIQWERREIEVRVTAQVRRDQTGLTQGCPRGCTGMEGKGLTGAFFLFVVLGLTPVASHRPG